MVAAATDDVKVAETGAAARQRLTPRCAIHQPRSGQLRPSADVAPRSPRVSEQDGLGRDALPRKERR